MTTVESLRRVHDYLVAIKTMEPYGNAVDLDTFFPTDESLDEAIAELQKLTAVKPATGAIHE